MLVLIVVAVVGVILWIRRRRAIGFTRVPSDQQPRCHGRVAGGGDRAIAAAVTRRWDGSNNTHQNTIEARGLTKRYGDKLAVDDLSFDVKPGYVTGFLGPNGAGKSTTMRMIMGLDEPDGGTVAVNGRRYHDLAWPLREVGALLEARAIHPGPERPCPLVDVGTDQPDPTDAR